MRFPGASSWFLSFVVLAAIFACGIDGERNYEGQSQPYYVVPEIGFGDRHPTVDEGGNTLAWVRTRYGMAESYVLRVEGRGDPETVLVSHKAVTSIDLAIDGRSLLGLAEGDTQRVFIWRQGPGAGVSFSDVPPEYVAFTTPRWADTTSFLFGAIGPEGRGVYRWYLEPDSIAPLCTRFSEHGGAWLGSSPGLDHTRRQVCMERLSMIGEIQSIVCPIGSEEPTLTVSGNSPSFWPFLPGEDDGLLYVDSSARLHGLRRSTGEDWILLPYAVSYDISADGRWLFADAALELGRFLTLLDLRSLR